MSARALTWQVCQHRQPAGPVVVEPKVGGVGQLRAGRQGGSAAHRANQPAQGQGQLYEDGALAPHLQQVLLSHIASAHHTVAAGAATRVPDETVPT